MLRTQSDERLVDLVRAGSEPAFEAIVARYRRALLRYCTRIMPEERAEDAVQQTFVRAYDAMHRSSAELALRPWLYRIAHNTALNALRDRGLRHEALDDNIDGVEQPDQAFERAQGLRTVLAAVQGLPERQRDAIVLREFEGRSYDEIAIELGVTGGAVRQLLLRARHSVRAAATAVTPAGLLLRVPLAAHGQPLGERIAELSGAAGGGAIVAKVCATALVTGALVGGVAMAPEDHHKTPSNDKPSAGPERRASNAPGADGSAASGDPAASHAFARVRTVSGHSPSGRPERRGRTAGGRAPARPDDRGDELTMRRDSSGPGSGGGEDRSGSSPTGSGDGGSSEGGGGPGPSIAAAPELDGHSGSGSSGSGTSGSDGSGSGSSGSGSSGSGSGDSVPEPSS